MVKYSGPKVKIIRRLGTLPGLTSKTLNLRKGLPGKSSESISLYKNRTSLSDDFRERLLEKQKLKYNYGVTEAQLFSYYKKAKQKKGSTGLVLLQLLESRLDSIVYRLGFAPTIFSARQLVNHGHILVNERSVYIPSFICKPGDIIEPKRNSNSVNLVSRFYKNKQEKRNAEILSSEVITEFENLDIPDFLNLDSNSLKGKFVSEIKKEDIELFINELKVIEYYSK